MESTQRLARVLSSVTVPAAPYTATLLRYFTSGKVTSATKFSVPFGGFFSCQSTNLLAGGQSRCLPQFSQHLVAISDGCQVLYCVKSGIFTGGELLPIRLPPFTRPPVISMLATNTVAVMTEGDRAWVRIKDTKMWKLAKPEDINKMSRLLGTESLSSKSQQVGVAFGTLALIALVVAAVVLVVKKRKRSLASRSGRGYEEIQSAGQCETSVECQVEQEPMNMTDNQTQSLLA